MPRDPKGKDGRLACTNCGHTSKRNEDGSGKDKRLAAFSNSKKSKRSGE